VGCEFKACFEEQNFGLELKNALDNLITRVPLQDLRIVCTAIMIQKESGGNLAEVLDKTAHVIRERFRLRRQVMTHTAQGRLTGWILTLLPVALAFALYTVNPDMMSILWKREIGLKLMYTAIGMIIVGGLIIRKIVNMDV
jgi:tight adherence protein B